MSSGHDEYWSARSGPTSRPRATPASTWRSSAATRCSGRRAGSRASTARNTAGPHARLLQGHALQRAPWTRVRRWTGTWRDPRFTPPADGGRPENALTGQFFLVNSRHHRTITVPFAYKNLRLWRNTAVATPGRGPDRDARAGHPGLRVGRGRRQRVPARGPVRAVVDDRQRPRGLHRLRQHTSSPGTATHNLTMYRAPSGALRVRRRHRAVGVGPRRLEPGRRRRRSATCSRRRSTCSPTWAPSPRRCMSGPDRGHDVDRHAPRRPRRSRRPRRRDRRRRPAGDDHAAPRPTPAAASSPASRSRPTAAPPGTRRPAPRAGPTRWTAHGNPSTDDQGARRRRQRQPRDAGRGRHGQRSTARARCGARATPCPRTPTRGDADRGRGRGQVQVRHARAVTGVRFYKAAANTGTHIGSLWTADRDAAGPGDLHRRDGLRLAERHLRQPGRRSTPGTTYVASYYAPNGHYAARTRLLLPRTPRRARRRPQSTARPCTRSATRTGGQRVCTSTAARAPSRSTRSRGQLLGRRDLLPTAPPDRRRVAGERRHDVVGRDRRRTRRPTSSPGRRHVEHGRQRRSPRYTVTPFTGGDRRRRRPPVTGVAAPATIASRRLTRADRRHSLHGHGDALRTAVGDRRQRLGAATNPVHARHGHQRGRARVGRCTSVAELRLRPAATVDSGDTTSVELGVKFKADYNGSITGVRFYKARTNTGDAHRQPVVVDRHAPGAGDLRRRDAPPAGRR